MKNYFNLRTLNMLEPLEQKPELKPDNDPQENIPAPVNKTLWEYLKEATIIKILKDYGLFMINESDDTAKEATEHVSRVASILYERGEISVAAIKHISAFLDVYNTDNKAFTTQDRKVAFDFVSNILIDDMPELLKTQAVSDPVYRDFFEVVKLEEQLHIAKCELVTKYKPHIDRICAEFFASYKNIFCDRYLERYEVSKDPAVADD